jgi:hypothetical protein
VVVATQDWVLVSRQKDANGLKQLVAKLKTVAPAVTESTVKNVSERDFRRSGAPRWREQASSTGCAKSF